MVNQPSVFELLWFNCILDTSAGSKIDFFKCQDKYGVPILSVHTVGWIPFLCGALNDIIL